MTDVLAHDSTPEEKKKASDRFAKINWAYSTLSGKLKDDTTYQSGRKTDTSSSSPSDKWTPPHRRSGQTYSSKSDTKADWRDFMPKEEVDYNTDGDSFGKIFSDLFTSAAAGTAGGTSGLFKDFIEFLEGNVEGFSGGAGGDDVELRILLTSGSKSEIRNEIDDTELVVNQLNAKLSAIANEITMLEGELRTSTKYLDKMKLDESMAELKAQQNVALDYRKKAQKRLLLLQTRYQELMTSRNSGSSYTREQQPTWEEIKRESTTYSRTEAPSTTPSSKAAERQDSTNSDEDSWMNQGFGSSSRGRGRSRRSRSSTRDGSSRNSSPSSRDSNSGADRKENVWSNYAETGKSSSPGNRRRNLEELKSIPPHRRKNSYSNQDEDRRRMREIKVDEEFDKLKKDLGL